MEKLYQKLEIYLNEMMNSGTDFWNSGYEL